MLDGYVNAVERESRVLPSPRGKFIEKIRAKTFERALSSGNNVDLLFNHDKNRKLGSLTEGNLQLQEDNIGLRAIATISDDEVVQKAKEGRLQGWSFGFVDNKSTWEEHSDGIQRRTLEDIELLEVSILDKTPAYVGTSVEARGEIETISETRGFDFKAEIEDILPEERKHVDYSTFEKEIELLKMKGGNH